MTVKNRKTLPCYYAFFTNGMMVLVIGAILPNLIKEAQINYSIAGGLLSSLAIGNFLASFILPVSTRYIGRKTSAILLSAFIPISLFMITLMPPIPIMYAIFLMLGIGRGTVSIINNLVVNEIDGRTSSLNLLHTMFATGAFLAPFITVIYFNLGFSWRHILYTVVLLSCFSTLGYTGLENVKNNVIGSENKDKRLIKNLDFFIVSFILFFYLGVENCVNGWFVTYFKSIGIMSDSYATNLVSITWFLIMLGRITVAYISTKLKKQMIILMNSIMSIIFFGMLISTTNLIVITIAVAGLGFFLAGIYPTSIANAGEYIKGSTVGMSFLLAIAAFGGITMPQIVGFLADKIGIYSAIAFLSLNVIIMGIFAMINVIRSKYNKKYV